jgi:hypothetical protein
MSDLFKKRRQEFTPEDSAALRTERPVDWVTTEEKKSDWWVKLSLRPAAGSPAKAFQS